MTGLDGGVSLEKLVNHRVCPVCARWLPPAGCERCRRLKAIGVLVRCVMDAALRWPEQRNIGLDAVAYLLTDRAQLVRAHRKERNEDAREAQRDARSAYDQGRDDGASREPGW